MFDNFFFFFYFWFSTFVYFYKKHLIFHKADDNCILLVFTMRYIYEMYIPTNMTCSQKF